MNEESRKDGIDALKENIRTFDSVKDIVVPPHLQQLAKSIQMMNNALVSAIQSDAMRAVINMGHSIAKYVASLDFTPMLKKFSEAMIPIKYIDLLERLKWPVFLIDDEDLRNKILLACNEQEDADAVREIIFDYCSNEFLEAMEQDWNACPALKETRKPILIEAMQLHKSGFYYIALLFKRRIGKVKSSKVICSHLELFWKISHLAQKEFMYL